MHVARTQGSDCLNDVIKLWLSRASKIRWAIAVPAATECCRRDRHLEGDLCRLLDSSQEIVTPDGAAPADHHELDEVTRLMTSDFDGLVDLSSDDEDCSDEACECEFKDTAMLEAEAKELYALADVNNDGLLSKGEMKKVIQKDPDVRKRLVSGGWKDFFAELDIDGDGSIECEELVNYYVCKLSVCEHGNIFTGLTEEEEEAAAAAAKETEKAEAAMAGATYLSEVAAAKAAAVQAAAAAVKAAAEEAAAVKAAEEEAAANATEKAAAARAAAARAAVEVAAAKAARKAAAKAAANKTAGELGVPKRCSTTTRHKVRHELGTTQ